MSYLLPAGVVLFVGGLVLSHVVLGLTRSAARKRQGMARWHRVLMWLAVALVGLGVALGAVGYFVPTEP